MKIFEKFLFQNFPKLLLNKLQQKQNSYFHQI